MSSHLMASHSHCGNKSFRAVIAVTVMFQHVALRIPGAVREDRGKYPKIRVTTQLQCKLGTLYTDMNLFRQFLAFFSPFRPPKPILVFSLIKHAGR